jgi:hypothetical protein
MPASNRNNKPIWYQTQIPDENHKQNPEPNQQNESVFCHHCCGHGGNLVVRFRRTGQFPEQSDQMRIGELPSEPRSSRIGQFPLNSNKTMLRSAVWNESAKTDPKAGGDCLKTGAMSHWSPILCPTSQTENGAKLCPNSRRLLVTVSKISSLPAGLQCQVK